MPSDAGEHLDFRNLLDAALCDRPGVVVFLRAYFDESERPEGTFTVSGYAFQSDQAKRFDRSWRKMLDPYKIFRTADLNSRKGIYEGIASSKRDAMIREAVRIVNQRFSVGVAISCSVKQFARLRPKSLRFHRDPYPFLCHFCVAKMSALLGANNIAGNVAYFFEAGHKCQGDANRLMELVHANPHFKSRFHYKSHTFLDKEDATPLQAADLLAWEWGKYVQKSPAQPIRKSLESLIEHDHRRIWCFNLTERHLQRWFARAEENDFYKELFWS
jgi:hypothetical protein